MRRKPRGSPGAMVARTVGRQEARQACGPFFPSREALCTITRYCISPVLHHHVGGQNHNSMAISGEAQGKGEADDTPAPTTHMDIVLVFM